MKITISNITILVVLITVGSAIFIHYFYQKKLELFDCENDTFANSCFKCTKVPNQTVDFLVDSKGAKVLWRSYGSIKGTEISLASRVLENCKIFDTKNWECNDSYMLGRTYVYKVNQMTNGVFSSYDKWNHELQKGIQCAK